MNHPDRAAVAGRLKRIAGQVSGLQRMVDEDRYCVDILTQIAAVRSALDAVGVRLLTGHLQHCVAERLGSGSRKTPRQSHAETANRTTDEMIDEVSVALGRFLR